MVISEKCLGQKKKKGVLQTFHWSDPILIVHASKVFECAVTMTFLRFLFDLLGICKFFQILQIYLWSVLKIFFVARFSPSHLEHIGLRSESRTDLGKVPIVAKDFLMHVSRLVPIIELGFTKFL